MRQARQSSSQAHCSRPVHSASSAQAVLQYSGRASSPQTGPGVGVGSVQAGMFAVTTIEAWWTRVGAERYPDAREIFITADAGRSNGHRSHVWKYELQRLADKLGLAIRVSHFPPGTSKWNKIEHRLFSFISINWRGRPLRTFETVVNLIANTTNRGGRVVRARRDRRRYPTGKKVSKKDLEALNVMRDVTDQRHRDDVGRRPCRADGRAGRPISGACA